MIYPRIFYADNELHPPTGAMVCSLEAMTIFAAAPPEWPHNTGLMIQPAHTVELRAHKQRLPQKVVPR